MNVSSLEKHFARMGARVQIVEPRNSHNAAFGIDIASDSRGEYFSIEVPPREKIEMMPLEVRPEMRHLLLMVRQDDVLSNKYLCGHDERHWFVAGVPSGSASSVKSAMESLRPVGLNAVVERRVKRSKNRLRRKNEAFVRQGEWFFLPEPNFRPKENFVLRHEPLSRGNGGKPHWCEELYRDGGVPVYVCTKYPRGVSYERYQQVMERTPDAKNWDWRLMRLNAQVYARGRVSHADHKTIVLPFWHRVLMNNEHLQGVVFLD
jgi:hypothetical protein